MLVTACPSFLGSSDITVFGLIRVRRPSFVGASAAVYIVVYELGS